MILGLLLAFLSVLVIFGGAIRFAQGRARTPASSSDQSHRILIPAFVFTLGITLYALLALVGWAPVVFVIATILSAALINGLGSLIVISGFDLAAKAMDARRTRSWLIAASAVFVGGTALAFLISQGAFSGRGIAALTAARPPCPDHARDRRGPDLVVSPSS